MDQFKMALVTWRRTANMSIGTHHFIIIILILFFLWFASGDCNIGAMSAITLPLTQAARVWSRSCAHQSATNWAISLEEVSHSHSTKSFSLSACFSWGENLNDTYLQYKSYIRIQGTKFMTTSWAKYRRVTSQDRKLVETHYLQLIVRILQLTFNVVSTKCFVCQNLYPRLQINLDWWGTVFIFFSLFIFVLSLLLLLACFYCFFFFFGLLFCFPLRVLCKSLLSKEKKIPQNCADDLWPAR